MLCARFDLYWTCGSEEEDFLVSSLYFKYFVIISPWKRAWPFIWINLNHFHLRMLCYKFGWNWPSGSGVNVKSLQTDKRTTDDRRSESFRGNNVRKQPCVGFPYLLPSMQCAAVRTMSGSMRVPPQTSSPDARIPACQGQAEGSASVPPMIRRLGSCTALPDPPSKPL